MSKNTSNAGGGNDGSWFLEAVGARDKTPTPIEAVADLEAENTEPELMPAAVTASPDAMEMTAFDGDPGTSTSSFHPVPAMPPPPSFDEVAEEAEPTSTPPPVDLDDTELPPALRTRRNFRWPVIAVLVVLIAAVVAAAFWLPRAVEDEALVVRQDYYDAAADVRNYLPTSQGALDAITHPDSAPEQISESVPIIAELDTRAFALEAATAVPLPSVLPLVPSGPVDELVPLKARGAILGSSASDLSRRLGNAYVYRTSIPFLLNTGPLPISATTQEINEISVRLAETLATDAGVVADLPEDPTFAGVRDEAVDAVDRYAAWQDEYLAALTGEDPDAATARITEIEGLRTALVASNDDALLVFRSEADIWIVELAGELEAYMTDLSR